MLYVLLSQQTNLCISLHNQSDVLQHNGTNYKQLIFWSDTWPGTPAMGKYAFLYMWYWFGVVVFQKMYSQLGGYLSWVYVHSSICDTDLV